MYSLLLTSLFIKNAGEEIFADACDLPGGREISRAIS